MPNNDIINSHYKKGDVCGRNFIFIIVIRALYNKVPIDMYQLILSANLFGLKGFVRMRFHCGMINFPTILVFLSSTPNPETV